jgi:hypothetical protein
MVDAINDLLEEYGLFKVIAAPILALSVVGGLGWVLGTQFALLLALGLVAFVAIILAVAAYTKLGRMEDNLKRDQLALKTLRSYLYTPSTPTHVLQEWRDTLQVSSVGDVSYVRRFTIRVDTGAPLHFFRFVASGERLSRRRLKQMRFEARLEPGGGQTAVEVDWTESDRFHNATLWIHLPNPLGPGEETKTIELTYTWPRTLAKLKDGKEQRLAWSFSHPVERLEFVVLLDKKLCRGRPFKYVIEGPDVPLEQDPQGSNWQVKGGLNPNPGENFGLRLEPQVGR